MANLESDGSGDKRVTRLRDALRRARIEAADRSAVVVDLRDAEVARLEILNDGLDPLFAEIPDSIDLFDRGISRGDTPRLWIDVVAHVVMGRDKRQYRFVQDTRFGRIVLAESHDAKAIVTAITDYVARRIIEREHALVSTTVPTELVTAPATVARSVSKPVSKAAPAKAAVPARGVRWWTFAIGFVAGMAALLAFALLAPQFGL